MKVLNSSKAFCEHYAEMKAGFMGAAMAAVGGSTAAGGVIATSATAAGAAAVQASAWSALAGWPLVGTFAAGKAAAVGAAASAAAASSAMVILPTLVLGGGVAYGVYRLSRRKRTLQGSTGIERLADKFAHIALLPMMAAVVSTCQANSAATDSVEAYVRKELGAWGYSEEYVQARLMEAFRQSPEEINGNYEWEIGKLKSGSAEDIGATPVELNPKVVCRFADEFRRGFESCLG